MSDQRPIPPNITLRYIMEVEMNRSETDWALRLRRFPTCHKSYDNLFPICPTLKPLKCLLVKLAHTNNCAYYYTKDETSLCTKYLL